ncbi:MAG TPA: SOS response-associated peptidase [Burkholderiales bacterium]|jgi:putative SOS response-associated peptidase YedK|nr:SOS response-associated peptidase [Burkholderiales bacterium]
MCGRFALHAHPDVVKLQFGLAALPPFDAHYNIAPTMPVLIVRRAGDAAVATNVRWGLVPHWAKDPSMGARMNNARAETVAEKPAFRDAYRSRRCLIPASGFYEWKSEFGLRQPYYVHPAEGELFAFAGLWEQWRDLQTCAVITTEANAKMAAVHDRMPVIVARADYAAWLGGQEGLLRPCPEASIAIRRVSRAVNNARNDEPALIEGERQ